MLDVFRRAAKGWTAKILMGLLVVSFGVWGIADVFRGFTAGTLATVGSQQISVDEAQRLYQQRLRFYSEQSGKAITPEEARRLGLDRLVLSELLRDAALDSQASQMKLAIADPQIAEQIRSNPAFFNSQGRFDPELFRQVLDRNGLNEALYVAALRRDFLRSAIVGTAEDDVALPKTLVEAIYKERNEQRDARYFTVRPTEQDIPKPSDQDLKKFYEDNRQTYTAPEYRSLAMMSVEPKDIAAKIEISDADIASAYDAHKADYFTPETRTILQMTFPTVDEARKAKDRLAKGEDFLAIAKERGMTEEDATLPARTKDSIPDPKLAEAAFALKEGEVSDPVEGRLAISLLKVTKITAEKQASLDEVRDQLKSRLQLDKAHDEIENTYSSVEDARAAQENFEAIAKRADLPFVLIPATDAGGLDKSGNNVDMPFKQQVLQQAFASDVGVENDALTTPSDGYVWYEVREVTPAALKPFDTVKTQVHADWTSRKTREVALEKARGLVERARNGVTLDALAQENGAEIKTVQGLKRNETNNDFDAGAVSALFSVPEGGFASAPDSDGKAAKVMQSQAVLLPPFDPASAEAKAISKSIGQSAGSEMLAQYVSELQKNLGVSVDEKLWSQVTGANAE
jgi:peptidyl-prolyl cis-trans isomerase D